MNKIHCLSSCLKYLLKQRGQYVREEYIAYSPNVFRIQQIGPYNFDTSLDQSILNWMKQHGHIKIFKKEEINFNNNSLLNIPIKFLTYSTVYNQYNISETMHFVVLEGLTKDNKIKIHDPFLPENQELEFSGELKISDELVQECVQIDFSLDSPLSEENFKINSNTIVDELVVKDWSLILDMVYHCDSNQSLSILLALASSSIEGSRILFSKINNDNGLIAEWHDNWLLLRVYLYRFYITNRDTDRKNAVQKIQNIKKVEVALNERRT